MPALNIEQRIAYTTPASVTIPDIVYALMGLERIIQRSPDVIEALFEDVHILRTEVILSDLHTVGSSALLQVKLVFGGQREYGRFLRPFGRHGGEQDAAAFMSAIIAALLLCGLESGARRPGADKHRLKAVEENLARIAAAGAPGCGVSPEDFLRAVEDTARCDAALAADALSVVKPVRSDIGEILFNGSREISIKAGAIAAAVPDVATDTDGPAVKRHRFVRPAEDYAPPGVRPAVAP